MCTSKANGGNRCAAHTRPDYTAALDRIRSTTTTSQRMSAQVDGMADIAFHAATRTGEREVRTERNAARRANDIPMAAYLNGCLNVAKGIKEHRAEVAAETAAQISALASV